MWDDKMSEVVKHAVPEAPLVSCIMPTANRRPFVPRAIHYFLRQDYEPKELLIVDDGADPIGDLVPADDRIKYIRLDKTITVGAKRNFACEKARGEIIVHWDDDDWHAPHQISYQVNALCSTKKSVCGINRLLFYDTVEGQAWQYLYPPGRKAWLSGSSLCYTRAFWSSHRFADIDVGEDGRFVWAAKPGDILLLSDHTFHVGIIHVNNVSPKLTRGSFWNPYPIEEIKKLLGSDWDFYHNKICISKDQPRLNSGPDSAKPDASVRNVYACLVHESQECVVDLVRNLRYLDPASAILLYNGGSDKELLGKGFPFERYGAIAVPDSRKLSWGKLHDFALHCMKFALEHLKFDTMTIVDSDQLGVRPDYSRFLTQYLQHQPGVGLLGNSPERQPPSTRIPPAMTAFKERELWRPFLRRFDRGEEKFLYWSFWPSTIFTSEAARDLVALFQNDSQLQEITQRSQLWATEEVIFPTLLALLGHKIGLNPCGYDFVKYRQTYTLRQIEDALSRPSVYWVHPISRRYDDPVRKRIRTRFDHYVRQSPGRFVQTPLRQSQHGVTLPVPSILDAMRRVEGWLEDDEAELMIAAASNAIRECRGKPTLVELGSYCGRATVVLGNVVKALRPEGRVYAIDAHDGRLGALDEGIRQMPGSKAKFVQNISAAGLSDCVNLIQSRPSEAHWEDHINLLVIDGLHDYVNVARDFFHYEPHVTPGAYILFHDYAGYYPGVDAFVNEILASGKYEKINCVRSLMVIRKRFAESFVQEEGCLRREHAETRETNQAAASL